MGSLREVSDPTNISALPRDVLASILASVASSSIVDLFNAESTSKEFHEAIDDVQVYKRVSLEFMPAISWKVLSAEALSFLKRCEETGNPEILYKHGMIEYFSKGQSEVGCCLLKRAADSGHAEATYAMGMILFCMPDTKPQGIELLESESMNIQGSRKRTKKILSEMWVSKDIALLHCRHEDNCLDSRCRNGGMIGWPSQEQWSWNGKIEKEAYSFCSANCKWSYEFNLFCDMIHGYGA